MSINTLINNVIDVAMLLCYAVVANRESLHAGSPRCPCFEENSRDEGDRQHTPKEWFRVETPNTGCPDGL